MVEKLPWDQGARLRLTPNCSLSWRNTVRIFAAMCGLSLIIVTGMIIAGAWVVLPFAGLELSALGAAFYYTQRQCRRQEVLELTGDTLRLEKGLYVKEQEWEMPWRYARVYMDMPRHPWTPPKLSIMYRGEEVGLARFLNLDDTRKLVDWLESKGLRIERRRLRTDFRF